MSFVFRQTTAIAAIAAFSTFFTGAALAEYPEKPITFLALSAPGSGFDTITRAVATTLAETKLITVAMPVTNSPSATVGMQTAVSRHDGDPYMLSFGSISGMTRYGEGLSEYTHKDITPIARLVADYYTIVVRGDSEFQTLEQLLAALRKDPRAFPISGGRSDDRVFYGVVFDKAGIDPAQINYVAFAGGGEAQALLLEGSAKALISSISDVAGLLESGQARALAVSGANRLPGSLSNVPTLQEAGVDLEWQNFRYAMGGPNMPPETVKFWQAKFAEMVKTPAWLEMRKRYSWGDEFMVEGLDPYLDETMTKILAAMKNLGISKR